MGLIGRPVPGAFILLAAALTPGPRASLAAQQPTPPDTALVQDTARAAQDTAAPDTLPPPTLFPAAPAAVPRAPALTRYWDHSALLSRGVLTMADVLEFVPLLQPIRAGFLEGPQASIFAGGGAVGLRYRADGYELAPIAGGPLDLHLLPLVEVQDLWLTRVPGGYELSSVSYENERREPYSRIEAGTGDRDANLIRAFFAGRFVGGPFGFGFDRIDTDGQPQLGSSERTVVWGKWAHELPGGVWGQVELRKTSADRDSFPAANRTDWILRLRRPLGAGWQADLVGGSASVTRTPVSLAGIPDSLADVGRDFGARQAALRVGRSGEHSRTLALVRVWDGDGVPAVESEASIDLSAGPLDLHLSGRVEEWDEFRAESGLAGLVLRLPLGLRLLAEAEDGARGLFGGIPVARELFTRVSAGGELVVGRWRLGGRGGRWRVEPSPTLGLPFDSAGPQLRGRTVNIGEGWVGGPLLRLFGGEVEGGFRYRARDQGPFLYWPQDEWRLEGVYHYAGVHGQLDIWLRGFGGVRGPLLAPDPEAAPVGIASTGPLNWFFAELVVRVRDVHLYYNYEFFDSAEVLGDLPAFELPRSRYHFGVKWEFWN